MLLGLGVRSPWRLSSSSCCRLGLPNAFFFETATSGSDQQELSQLHSDTLSTVPFTFCAIGFRWDAFCLGGRTGPTCAWPALAGDTRGTGVNSQRIHRPLTRKRIVGA